MQRFIFKQKNKITLVSFILIITAFIAYLGFDNNLIFNINLIIASIIGVIPIALQAYSALRVKVVSIDVLVTIAVIGAFLIQNYEEASIVTFLFLFGAFLEQKTMERTRSAIKGLTEMQPESAHKLMPNGEFVEVEVEEVKIGDVVLVRTGAKVPIDGNVIEGNGYINEATITGESRPSHKEVNSYVYAGTILDNGTIQVVATQVGEDTTFGKIIELVEEAQDSKSNAERFIDKFSLYYTPLVLLIALVVWLVTQNVPMAITTLVLGCPGALVIGVPVSNVAGIGNGARNGVLIKGSAVMQSLSKVDTVVFDKTGTLTRGEPEVSEVKYYENSNNNFSNAEVYKLLSSIEKESDHPLATAVVNYKRLDEYYRVDDTNVVKGGGIISHVNDLEVIVGNLKLMIDQGVKVTVEQRNDIKRFEEEGNSIVITAINNEILLLIGIKDQIREGVYESIEKLKRLGMKDLIVLSGDNQGTVDLVARELGLTKAIGNLLPEDKADYIKELQSRGRKVAFVGDGVNDSPSLALAEIGIAMGGGTDVAIETSDVVLMNSSFTKLPYAIALAKKTVNNIIQNVVLALGVVLALFYGLFFGDWMNMAIGMLVHEGSILLVIFNGIRLLGTKFSKIKRFESIELLTDLKK